MIGSPVCKDCYPEKGDREAASIMGGAVVNGRVVRARAVVENSGGRCATHWREKKRASKQTAHEAYLWRTYRMPPGTYQKLLAYQGGTCYMCRRATGATKKLAVDHDHACCPTTPTCGKCTRGLLCSVDNKFLGHGRDDPHFFFRGMSYLVDPPYSAMLEEGENRE